MSCRILVFSEYWYPFGGGAELATFLYARELANLGHYLTVVTYRELSPPTCGIDGIEYIRLSNGHLTGSRYDGLINWPETKEWLLRRLPKVDLIYVPGNWVAAIALGRRYGIPTVAHLHNYAIVCPASILYDPLAESIAPCVGPAFVEHERRMRGSLAAPFSAVLAHTLGNLIMKILRLADALICVSDAQLGLIARLEPKLVARLRVVYNPAPPRSAVPLSGTSLLYMGGSAYYKGYHVLLDALRRMDSIPGVEILALGVAPTRKTRAVGEWRVLECPWMARTELRGAITQATVVAVPSISPEPLPYAAVEAIVSGRLVVASEVGGFQDIARMAPKSVLMVRANDPDDLADRLACALSMQPEELADRMRGEAERVASMLEPRRQTQQLVSQFKVLLDKANES